MSNLATYQSRLTGAEEAGLRLFGLKPVSFRDLSGTAEAVPFPKALGKLHVTMLVREVLLGEPELQSPLLTRCQFYEADANVSAFILPRDFGSCFQSGACAGQVE